MTSTSFVKAYIDISNWWPKEENGELRSVYAVFESIKGTSNHVTRYTLTNAREGKLENANIVNVVKLARICSMLSGKKVAVDDIIKVEE